MTNNLISLVRSYSTKIENGRSLWTILEAAKGELIETEEEVLKIIDGEEPGTDGVPGEAIDVILCLLDLIFKANPEMTDEEIVEYARKKCEKWKRIYS